MAKTNNFYCVIDQGLQSSRVGTYSIQIPEAPYYEGYGIAFTSDRLFFFNAFACDLHNINIHTHIWKPSLVPV